MGDIKEGDPLIPRIPDDHQLRAVLRGASSGHRTAGIDCSYSDKDADLTPRGNQGVQLVCVKVSSKDALVAHLIAYVHHSYSGLDACLNYSSDDPEKCGWALDAYLQHAEAYLASVGVDWDGDSWEANKAMPLSVPISSAWGLNTDATLNATLNAIKAAYDKAMAPYLIEQERLHLCLDQLAGWKDDAGDPIKEGDPTPLAAWAHLDGMEA